MHVKMETFSSPTNFGELLHLPDNCREEAIGSFFSTVVRQNVFFFGGGADLAERNLGYPGEKKPGKVLKFSFLKSLQMHPILKTSSYKESKLNSKYSWRTQHLPYNYTENKFQLEVLINVV